MKKKVYGYKRVSTETQVEHGFGLDAQEAAIRKYCEDNDFELVKIFEDRGISGTETVESDGDELISKRDGLVELISNLNGINTIVVMNTSRLWRSDIAKVLIRREIEKKGGDIISIEQPSYSIYAKDHADMLINGMIELLDSYERLNISIKLAKGRTTKATKGLKPNGKQPFGYRWAVNRKETLLDRRKVTIVRKIFELKAAGVSYSQICTELNREYPEKNWTTPTLQTMLKNDFYLGIVTHAGKKFIGQHEAIIGLGLWNKVNNTNHANINEIIKTVSFSEVA